MHDNIKKELFIIDDDKLTAKKRPINKTNKNSESKSKNHIVLNLSDYLEKEEDSMNDSETFVDKNENKRSKTRSEELFNKRKQIVIERMYDYLIQSPPITR